MATIQDLFPGTFKIASPPHRFPGVSGDCWIWRGKLTERGYGVCQFRGKMWHVHRLSLMLACGPNELLPNLHACHKCDIKACCNPDHLFVATGGQNSLDFNKWRFVIKGVFPGNYEEWRKVYLQDDVPEESKVKAKRNHGRKNKRRRRARRGTRYGRRSVSNEGKAPRL